MTWNELVSLARQLHADEARGALKEEDSAQLVRLLLRFNEQLTEPIRQR